MATTAADIGAHVGDDNDVDDDDDHHGDHDHGVLIASVLLGVFNPAAVWAARARRQRPARSKIPCWPLPLRVTARSAAQPAGSAFRKR
jgi:hypothetical protein